jgi:streptomycin 6-kinase
LRWCAIAEQFARHNAGVPDLELPTNLVREMTELDAPRRTWLADLPAVVETVSREWSLEVGRPFQPGGVTSWTAPARTAAGERVVLKVGWRHDEALHEADGLAAWNGDGAVRLLAHRVLDHTTALLEACEPGTPLSDIRPPEEQDVVIAGLLRRLWIEPAADSPFRPLTSMCDVWADEFEEKLTRAPHLDPGLARTGMELFRELPRTATQSRLLCTDLHPDNVLSARHVAAMLRP